MKQRAILLIFVMMAAIGAVLFVAFSPAVASSHREAPLISTDPMADNTDVYAFVSYEPGRENFVTLIANWIPFQEPAGGPNFYTLDPDARYRINIENNGNLNEANDDIVFEFQFFNILNSGALPVGDEVVEHPPPSSLWILGLSLAFQAQFLALADPRDERIGAANASERSCLHRRYGYMACH